MYEKPNLNNLNLTKKLKQVFLSLLLSFNSLDAKSQIDPSNPYFTINKEGVARFYHNPHESDNDIHFSFGVTLCPYLTFEEIKNNTSIPVSLTETDFFTNYLNALGQTKNILYDDNTGNPYQDPAEIEHNYQGKKDSLLVKGVDYLGPNKHWNIHRFLIETNYGPRFKVDRKQADLNVFYDVYKYFLYFNSGDREKSFIDAQNFIDTYINPVLNSYFSKWYHKNINNFYSDIKIDTDFYIINSGIDIDYLITCIFNFNLFSDSVDNLYSRTEIIDIVADYYHIYNKHSRQEAREMAESLILSKEKEIIDRYVLQTKSGNKEEISILKKYRWKEGNIIN